jgi:serine phosphatase RsbU (regulator of sigma subunit)
MDSLSARRDAPLEEIARGLLSDIRAHVAGAEQYDDMTFLFMRVE